MLPSSHMIY